MFNNDLYNDFYNHMIEINNNNSTDFNSFICTRFNVDNEYYCYYSPIITVNTTTNFTLKGALYRSRYRLSGGSWSWTDYGDSSNNGTGITSSFNYNYSLFNYTDTTILLENSKVSIFDLNEDIITTTTTVITDYNYCKIIRSPEDNYRDSLICFTCIFFIVGCLFTQIVKQLFKRWK